MNKCKDCKMRKNFMINFRDKKMPFFYQIDCGLCPKRDYESDCEHFKKKSLLQKLLLVTFK